MAAYLDQEVRALDIEAKGVVKVLLSGVEDVAHGHGGGVCDDGVDLAELRDGGVDELLNVGDLAGVGLDGNGAVLADGLDEGVGGVAVAEVVDDDAGAVAGNALGDSLADAVGRAGDEDDLAEERHGVRWAGGFLGYVSG